MTVQKISVIVPAYNAENTIEKTIRSILAQDWPDFEVIVVDDGSTDRTAQICARICAQTSSKQLRVLSQPNAGPAAARNLALDKAEGELICFVDADDTIQEDCLRTLALTIRDAQMAVSGYRIVHKDGSTEEILPAPGRFTGAETMKRVLYDETVDGYLWNKIFRADIIRENGIRFDERIYVGEDMLFVENYLSCCTAVQMIDRPLYDYSVAGQSISHALTERNLSLLRAFSCAFALSEDKEYRDLAVNRYVRQYLVFYVLYPDKVRLEKQFGRFLDRSGYTDSQILAVLPRMYRARFRLYRFSRPLYAASMSGLRGVKDVLFGRDRVLKKKR